MARYSVRPYKCGGWVIVETKSGREIILFNAKDKAEEACSFLSKEESEGGTA